MGMCLHDSLMTHAQPFHLWILCTDTPVEQQLKRLSLPNVTIIPLEEIENDELLKAKQDRTIAEYCWTLTPFTFQAVFDRDKNVDRVTYVDADLFFFSDPRTLINELDTEKKDVLITEHAYAPDYEYWLPQSGRFCVQFLTVGNNEKGRRVMTWWQNRCVEWCYARFEDGKFGDQKYLDQWPLLFPEIVHILTQRDKTLAPWNIFHVSKNKRGNIDPVFFHFHGLKIASPDSLWLCSNYRIGKQGLRLYQQYKTMLQKNIAIMRRNDFAVRYRPVQISIKSSIRRFLERKPGFSKLNLNCD